MNAKIQASENKLKRLNEELTAKIQMHQDHVIMANGQPMNDKRCGAAYFRKEEKITNSIFNIQDKIKKQEEIIERLKSRKERKERGLSSSWGIEMSIRNIPKIKEAIMELKADEDKSTYCKAKLRRWKKGLEELEKMRWLIEQSLTNITEETQKIIDSGQVTKWEKHPHIYFVKGLKKVALVLTVKGRFVISSNYPPKTEEDKKVLENILN